MIKTSEFSQCGKYRYLLTRIWDENLPIAMCIGLNPSKAGRKKKDGTEEDDQTISRLIKTLTALGFGGLKMTNLYGFIATKPKILLAQPDPVGSNDAWLQTTAYGAQEIIFCWGSFKRIEYRVKRVREMFPSAKCFGKNKNGSPWHPLAMMYDGLKTTEATLIDY